MALAGACCTAAAAAAWALATLATLALQQSRARQGAVWGCCCWRPHSSDATVAVTLRSSLVRVGRAGRPAAGVGLGLCGLELAQLAGRLRLCGPCCAARAARPCAAVHAQHAAHPWCSFMLVTHCRLCCASRHQAGGGVMARRACCAVSDLRQSRKWSRSACLMQAWLLCLCLCTSTGSGRRQLPVWWPFA
jgi:hypothetical protein